MNNEHSHHKQMIHDFQADLHSLVATIEQLKKHWGKDPDFCLRALELAAGRTERVVEMWHSLRAHIKDERSQP